ncbi:23S rRNA (cytosine1962-C5)-methyltransferase [Prosthecobacter debontii]|uniref:23S rRNA (Cytosine1962-C5)-methyltransferase n=1 Tax=Prosthecobacter debontii TaxID=48467 RepID=A0A1T4Y813_9BACT|nr:class I SAM-dependent rRNA methyltransferase [Prosthecobacter debontii]SKA97813.1 23S rRNA (cytosine1962-C5)-methyltransferase [Prosthecobacter debontii]
MSRPYPQRRPASAPKPPPAGSENWARPWAQMKYFSYHPAIYPNMVGATSDDAAAGDLVNVYNKEGNLFGAGFLNPKARVPLRVIHHGSEPFTEADLDARLLQAIRLRRDVLKLDKTTEAYRVIHSDADGISGLIVDRYAQTLSILVTTLGVWRRIRRWLPLLHKELGTSNHVIQTDPDISLIENMRISEVPEVDDPGPRVVRVRENDVRYLVNFEDGHKTGFFCDQRDNRLRFGQMAHGRVLDLCTYTGGFALSAKIIGGCEDVTGVDLDEKAIAQAKQNANLNQTKINWTQGDAFGWSRQMIKNGELWDTVVLDPPKLIHHRDSQEEGIFKYRDLNGLAIQLVKRGGLFVTCSCSGLISPADFEELVVGVAHRHGRKLQILDHTGPGMDHPVMSNCPESRYLKVVWAVVV